MLWRIWITSWNLLFKKLGDVTRIMPFYIEYGRLSVVYSVKYKYGYLTSYNILIVDSNYVCLVYNGGGGILKRNLDSCPIIP